MDPQKVDSYLFGFYGYQETDLNEKLRFILASRFDMHEVYESQFSPKAGLIFKPKPSAAFRFTFSRAFLSPGLVQQHICMRTSPVAVVRANRKGFRFGTVTGDPLPPQYENGIRRLGPEKLTALEIGFKGLVSDRVYVDINGHRARYRDFISSNRPIGDPKNGIVTLDEAGKPRAGEITLTNVNFGKQTVSGLGAGIDVYATDRVVLKGNASFLWADDLEDAQGLDVPFNAPEAILNLRMSTTDLVAEGTHFDLSLRHVTQYDYISGLWKGTLPAYTVVDMNAGYRSPSGVGYRLSVRNLLNNVHKELVLGPDIGRSAIGELQYEF